MGENQQVPSWKLSARAKRAAQAALIPVEWRLKDIPAFTNARDYIRTSGLLTPNELEITEITDARELVRKLQSRELSAHAVAYAYCKRAAIAQQLTGCLTEIFFKRALSRAKGLDEYFEREGRPIGPLHGIPISFKDNYDVEGVDSTIGWVGLIEKPAASDSLCVKVIIRLGAVVYVKTNIPQSLMVSRALPRISRVRSADFHRCPIPTTTSSSNRSTPLTSDSSLEAAAEAKVHSSAHLVAS